MDGKQMIQQLMDAVNSNPRFLLLAGISFLIGYLEYIYSVRLILREKLAPYPIWMHTFYFAHDITGGVVFLGLSREYGHFWFFTAASAGLFIWPLFEVFHMYMAVKVERQAIWGKFYDHPVTTGQATSRVLGQLALMFVLINLFRVYMNDVVMFKLLGITNIVMAVGPGYLWNERKSRAGSSVGLAILILIGTINTFLPPGFGMFTTALPYFNQPWFYLTGAVAALFALRNLLLLLGYPRKPSVYGKAAIW